MIDLGRQLFFDPLLSSNNERSCASCHNPQYAFSDGLAKSEAMDHNGTVSRNSPGLVNVAFQHEYFYDHRAQSLEQQIDHVIFNPKEFGGSFEQIINKLNQSEEYSKQFAEAFPAYPKNKAIQTKTIQNAIGAYVRSLVALNSPFDKFIRGESNELSISAQRGFNVFMGKAQCGTCHFPPLFNGTVPPKFMDTESEALGILTSFDTIHPTLDSDQGRFNEIQSPVMEKAFKTSTVRNTKLTAPYMHNGSFKTLEEVILFYDHGGGAGLGLDVPNQTLPSSRLNLNKQEIKDLVSFMESLTDTAGSTTIPRSLPRISSEVLNKRKIGGNY